MTSSEHNERLHQLIADYLAAVERWGDRTRQAPFC